MKPQAYFRIDLSNGLTPTDITNLFQDALNVHAQTVAAGCRRPVMHPVLYLKGEKRLASGRQVMPYVLMIVNLS